MLKRIVFVVLCLLLANIVLAQDNLSITIMHTANVLDAHFAGADNIGGTARLATVVEEARNSTENFVLVDTGDHFINPAHAQRNAEIMNLLGYTAATLGNHEFNGGNESAAAFIDTLNAPILAANVDFSASPILANSTQPYLLLDMGGEQVAIIGLANDTAPALSSPGTDLIFIDDEIEVTQRVVGELQAMGINKIILIAHRESQANIIFASAVSGIDVIVGGTDNTLFSNSDDNATQPYPVVTESISGEPVLIIHAPEGNRYIGRLDVTFDDAGIVTEWQGDAILLTSDIADNTAMAAYLATFAEETSASDVVIGETAIDLIGGDPCREEECNLGNLIADAIRQATGVQIAVYNSGGIRATILAGDITEAQVFEVLPFGNRVSTMELTGADILAMIEHGLSLGGDADIRGSGRFLQISGMRFTWNPVSPVGNRIVTAEVLGFTGEYEPLDPNAFYRVATNDFIRNGGDDFTMLAENAIDPFDFGPPADQIVNAYIRSNSPFNLETEGRITRQ